jgi:uncharacterized protein YifE (UPF0438 family)
MEKYLFSQKELKVLCKYLDRCEALDHGIRKPIDQIEKHFLMVCRGTHKANTVIEILYMKYKHNCFVDREKSRLIRKSSIPERIANRPSELWFTDSAWNKMHPDRIRGYNE